MGTSVGGGRSSSRAMSTDAERPPHVMQMGQAQCRGFIAGGDALGKAHIQHGAPEDADHLWEAEASESSPLQKTDCLGWCLRPDTLQCGTCARHILPLQFGLLCLCMGSLSWSLSDSWKGAVADAC